MKRARKNQGNVLFRGDPLWYKDAILYEVHVRTFHDSNADGIGDFKGLTEKLGYLQDLGVTALWLLPFYPSPLRDDGYDIADYTDIHSSYGTLADFQVFLREAHRRGLRVITELVVNHTSDRHPWFQRARHAPPGSTERNFYLWSETPDKYRDARIIFKDFESSNWTWDTEARAYFWHRFYSHQPDLNYDNPEVADAILQVLDFWLDMGVDELRLDAVPYLYEREGTSCENLPETHQFLKQLRAHINTKYRGRMLLAEANQWPEDAVAYFGQGDECQLAFHFPVMPRLFMALRMEDRFPIVDILEQTPPIPATCQWAIFLRNHDELTLEMVTEEDRDYMYRVYARDPQARINLGIRRRLAPLLENHRGKIELMNGLLFSLPGTPVLYYGDEIGMGDNIYLSDRNGVRTPMQWDAERNAGFSQANPQQLCLPVVIDPEYHYTVVNVETQQKNPHSLLWRMKRLIALRKSSQAFGRGSLEMLAPRNSHVFAFLRCHEDECLLVAANLSRYAQPVELDLPKFRGMVPVEMFGRTRFPAIEDRPYLLTLAPHTLYWFALQPGHADSVMGTETVPVPALTVTGRWTRIFEDGSQPALEGALANYLVTRRWFLGRGRKIVAARILVAFPMPAAAPPARLALVETIYSEGDSEIYFLPIAFAPRPPAGGEDGQPTQAPIARLVVQGQEGEPVDGVLYDPLRERAFTEALVNVLARPRRFRSKTGELAAMATPHGLPVLNSTGPVPEPVVVRSNQTHTSVVWQDRWVLKVFRHIEAGIHPAVEMGNFLQRAGFSAIAPVLGTFAYRAGGSQAMTLAILQGFVANQGDAWKYALEALGGYFERALTHAGPPWKVAAFPGAWFDGGAGELPQDAQESIGPYLESIRLLGRRTAALHGALASAPDDTAFAPEQFTGQSQRSLYQSLRSQIRRTFEQVGQRKAELASTAADPIEQILRAEKRLEDRLRVLLTAKLTSPRLRCHGDYHLRKVLYTGKDFVVIDLEGESALPFGDRRRKHSPLSDVATMIHSLHYCAMVALHQGRVRPEDAVVLGPAVDFWTFWNSVAFLDAYREAAAGFSFLPRTSEELHLLLDYYLLKRAVTDVRTELSNRPERVEIPVRVLARFVEGIG